MDKLLFKRILIAALTILALVYVIYLFASANFSMVATENAIQVTSTDKIFTNAFIIRDESILSNNSSGVLSYSLNDGDEVGVNGEIAKIYSSENDAAAQTKIDILEAQIEDLKTLENNKLVGSVGIETIDSEISTNLLAYLSDINNGEISKLGNDTSNLLSSINHRHLFTGKISDFDSEIAQLQAELDQLKSTSGESIGSIKTDKAGYFSEYCDGYEKALKYSDVDKLELSDLKNIKKSDVSSNTAGKVVSSLNWYVACEVSADEATKLTLWDGKASILFSDASTESIPANIYRIHQKNKDSSALLILECDYMNESLIDARVEPVEIGLGTYTGLQVSKRAIHDDYITKTVYDENGNKHTEEKKVQGVYTLYGSKVQFKQVSIMYSDDDYVICDPEPEEGILFNGETIELYDQVIIEGDDLYDGKVIE